MSFRRCRTALLPIAAIAAFLPAVADAWVVAQTRGFAEAGAVDSAGDVYTIGGSQGPGLVVTKLAGESGKRRWRSVLFPDGQGNRIALDSAEQVVAAGTRGETFAVTKLSRDTGVAVWATEIGSSVGGSFTFPSLALDAGDDVVVGSQRFTTNHFSVVSKLSGVDGSELWQRSVAGLQRVAVATDPTGNVIVAGLRLAGDLLPLRVHKLSGTDGSTLWERGFFVAVGFPAVVADAAGDVLVDAGPPNGNDANFAVLKLSSGTGSELWRFHGQAHGSARLQFAPDGDLLVTHVGSGDAGVFRVDPASGAGVWSAFTSVARVGFLPDGDLIGAGNADSTDAVVRLSGVTGAEVWRHPMFDTNDFIVDGGLAHDGVVGVGGRGTAVGVNGLLALKFATRLAGRNLVVQQDVVDPAKNRVVLGARDTRLIVSAASGGPQDPTVHGGVFELSNPVTGETATFPLPAASWTALPGSQPGREGYRYRDASGTTPCTKVIMKTAKTVTVECSGPLMTFSLDEPSQGSLRATLRLGSGGPDLCFEFGGSVREDVGTGATGKGVFAAKDAPPPTTCPGGF